MQFLRLKADPKIEVCVPELGTKRDETGRDWRPFPNCRDQDGTTNVWSCCSGQYGKNSGRDGTAQYHSGKVLNGLEMN